MCDPRLRDRRALARGRRPAFLALRRHRVRVDGDGGPGVHAKRRGASAQRLGVRRAARRVERAPGGIVALVEVGAPGACRPRADARVRGRRTGSARAGSIGRRARDHDARLAAAAAAEFPASRSSPASTAGSGRAPSTTWDTWRGSSRSTACSPPIRACSSPAAASAASGFPTASRTPAPQPERSSNASGSLPAPVQS